MKILMIGPERNVQGGISSVINNYYSSGMNSKVDLKYIGTMIDGNKIKKLNKAIKSYLYFIKNINMYDIIHVHMASRASFYRKSIFIKFAKRHKKKVIIHLHGAEFKEFYSQECNDKQKRYVKKIFSYADKIIALSEEWKVFLANICSEDCIEVVYNAVVVPKKINKDYNEKSILFLGRLGRRKGTYDLLKVIPKIVSKYPNVKFYLGGDGDIEQVNKICEESNIKNNVKILGWVDFDKKQQLLNNCGIYILPSYNEGMPMSLLEAMSYGKPVISTYVGGIPKVIKNNSNGVLFSAGDIDKLYNCLDELLSSEEKRKTLCMNALKNIKDNFDINDNINQIIKIYNNII